MNTVQHTLQSIPYNLLFPWNGNVRVTGKEDEIDSLAASIEAHGLIQPLVVSKVQGGKFQVVAGGRRLKALGKLVEAGKRAEDSEVLCVLHDKTVDSKELSLVENFMRLPMHPADQFEAFRDLADNGMAIADIAARFSIPDSHVLKLLKLGRLSTEVMQAYRDEKLNMGQIQAFAISDDHTAQNLILVAIEAGTFHSAAHNIRSHLVQGEIPATDKRVKLVGLDFYEMCGGTVRRDLFDDRNNGYIQDVALLDNCVQGKFQEIISSLKEEGWKWVEAQSDRDWSYVQQMEELSPEERELSSEEMERLETLQAEYEQYEDGVDEEDTEAQARVGELYQQIEAIQDSQQVWTAEQKAVAGVLVSLQPNGEVNIEYGLVKPEDAPPSEFPEEQGAAGQYVESASTKTKPEFSAALLKDLTAHRTAALRIELANRPDIALAAVVYSLAVPVCYDFSRSGNCIKVSGTLNSLFSKSEEPVTAVAALDAKLDTVEFPKDVEYLWDWCLARTQAELLDLLALCAAYTVNAVQQKDTYQSSSTKDVRHSHKLAAALNLDMRTWFTPTAANFFGRVSKKQIIGAYIEATGEQPSNSVLDMKKAGLAARAERDLGDKWLPSVLRGQPIEF